MNTFAFVLLATLAAFASGKPSGHGVLVSGPSGVVTGHGPIGPVGHGGHGWDDGSWDDGQWNGDDGHWDGAWDGGHSNVVHGNGATLVGPAVGHSVVAGPSVHGLGHGLGGVGVWGGAGVWGGYGDGHGHGVVVRGPHTVPATIVGPAGKVHADGLYGVGHGHGHW